MSTLYLNEDGARVGFEKGRFTVHYPDNTVSEIPSETLEGITVLGKAQLTTQCVVKCLTDGIPVAYFSKGGTYFGRLQSTGHFNAARQRKQCALYNTPFAFEISEKIVCAKLKNQSAVLNRYERNGSVSVENYKNMLLSCKEKAETCQNLSELRGYEGQGAKAYFEGLSLLINPEFAFSGRSRRPPEDEFNSLISFGYSVILNDVLGEIEAKGLSPYFGFMHRDAEKHPTLASDMMEEWRAVIVDSTAMSVLNGNEMKHEHFQPGVNGKGLYMTREGLRRFLAKLERKLQTEIRYLPYVDYPVTFRQAISLQLDTLVKAIENNDSSLYNPIEIW